jgi:hypothetical protein
MITGEGRTHHGKILAKAAALAEAGGCGPLLSEQRSSLADIEAAHTLVESGALGKVVVELYSECRKGPVSEGFVTSLYVPPIRMSSTKSLAFRTGSTYTRGVAKKKLPPEIRDYFVRMGKKGGALGGKTRAENLSPEERSESARKAVLVRWQRVKSQEEK